MLRETGRRNRGKGLFLGTNPVKMYYTLRVYYTYYILQVHGVLYRYCGNKSKDPVSRALRRRTPGNEPPTLISLFFSVLILIILITTTIIIILLSTQNCVFLWTGRVHPDPSWVGTRLYQSGFDRNEFLFNERCEKRIFYFLNKRKKNVLRGKKTTTFHS